MNKTDIRQRYRNIRRAVSEEYAHAAAHSLARHLRENALWRRGTQLALYLPSDGEIPTSGVIEAVRRDGAGRLFLPAVRDDGLVFCEWNEQSALESNRFGIEQPTGDPVDTASLDLILAPVVAWSSAGVRLGMGGGFYDRYLANRDESALPHYVGLAYDCQQCENLVPDPWDVPLDAVLTESGLRRFRDRR